MSYEHTKKNSDIHETLGIFEDLRQFDGSPPEFWAGYMDAARRLVEGDFALLLVFEQDVWKTKGIWPSARRKEASALDFERECTLAAQEAHAKKMWSLDSEKGGTLMAVALDSGEDTPRAVAIVYISDISKGIPLAERMTRLSLVADIPRVYRLKKDSDKARNDVIRFADTLDFMVLLNQEDKYMAAVMSFVNEIAPRFNLSRVSLGWQDQGYVRVQGISHMEKFEKKMDAVQLMESAMEETLDQDEEILFPQPEGLNSIVRAHGEFADKHGGKYILTLPIRPDGDTEAVLLCERAKDPFTENDIKGLRLFCDQSSRRLKDLKINDVWFGKRMARSLKDKLAGLLGVENTFYKALGIVCFFLLAFLLFGRMEYRVEAPFILKTDDVAYLPSPFEGYIKTVHVRVGDEVKANQLLLTLDTQELLIEESSAIADKSRYLRESEKSRARYALAEMKIAHALKEQAEAKLALIRYHLAHAEVKAPFAGIVVEGDLKEMLGAPVRKGDVLFKVARIEHLFAELDLDERDVHEIQIGKHGDIAFVSKPENSYPVKVDMINPVAMARDKGNVFPVRCLFEGKPEDWWRPGMSGISKINVGKRNVFWIITHRTVEFLRLFLWW
ncbi:MAG: efflux RND transporter periplasmic adaptor subunit [Proteobacteria bacterium]|nr:efflux RND transporter periplasmic adaptor subunit [Pseudomonadota bacterium]